jgi:predicted CXXCH cytochrome family protein
MKKALLALALAAIANVAAAAVGTSVHNLSSSGAQGANSTTAETCIFCHTAHATNTAITAAPLWNRAALGAVTWSMYTSTTLLNTIGAAPGANSLTCLACHEGSANMGGVYNIGGSASAPTAGTFFTVAATMTAAGLVGSDLRNDHPVGVVYDNTIKTNLVAAATVTGAGASGGLKLYAGAGATLTVECASCHDPHVTTNGNFLRKSNAASALCTTCHVN